MHTKNPPFVPSTCGKLLRLDEPVTQMSYECGKPASCAMPHPAWPDRKLYLCAKHFNQRMRLVKKGTFIEDRDHHKFAPDLSIISAKGVPVPSWAKDISQDR